MFKVIDISMETIYQKKWKTGKHEFCTNQICYRKTDASFKITILRWSKCLSPRKCCYKIPVKSYAKISRSKCTAFSRDQNISLHCFNANLSDVFSTHGSRKLLTQRKDYLQRTAKLHLEWQRTGENWRILYLHKSHNTPLLPPKFA